MRVKRTHIIGVLAALFIIVVLTRGSFESLILLLVTLAFTALPSLLLLGGLGVIGYLAYRYLVAQNGIALPPALSIPTATAPGTRELTDSLATSFRRNNPRRLQHTLATLPPWPITQELQATTDALFELKRSIYRAQAEGVPAPMIERYLHNLGQAADSVWQLASKVDAVGLQGVSYDLVAPRLQQEEQSLRQLQQALADSRDGIALLILSGTRSDVLHDVEDDLRALTQAIKRLELEDTAPVVI